MDAVSDLQKDAAMTDIEWIRKGLERPGKTQVGLAKALDRAPSAVSNLLKGARELKQREVARIAQYLEIEPPADAGEPMRDGPRPLPEFLGERDLKVFAAVEGGAGEMVVSTDPIELVPRPWYMKEVRDGYAVLVVGDSMFPTFEPGDMAIVNPRLPPMRGKDVILIGGEQDGEFRASIKRLEGWTATQWNLRQFNPPRGEKHEFSWAKRDWPKALRVVGKYYGG